ncbi:MAG: DUF3576 domain-containing protein [Hyphomonadaceae bacterium]
MTLSGRSFFTAAACLALSGALGACSSTGAAEEERRPGQSRLQDDSGPGLGLGLFGRGDDDRREGGTAEIGVNSFLWRASLDTLNFMPLASADPFGGVIITDWHTDPSRPNERFKATVYILDTRLRADALNVSIFRQELTSQGWQDVQVSPDTGLQIENAILTRARQIRLSTIENER